MDFHFAFVLGSSADLLAYVVVAEPQARCAGLEKSSAGCCDELHQVRRSCFFLWRGSWLTAKESMAPTARGCGGTCYAEVRFYVLALTVLSVSSFFSCDHNQIAV
jgi:hypothetical protein